MHSTAMANGRRFFDTYVAGSRNAQVLEIGSQDVNGSLRDVCPETAHYVGADFTSAKGVDVLLEDPYVLPFEDAAFDFIVCSSCYEHSEFFWLSFIEALRVLKPAGVDGVWKAFLKEPESPIWSRAFTLVVLGNYNRVNRAVG